MRTLDKLIKNGERFELRGRDIIAICRNRVNIVIYEDLNKYDSIFHEDLLGRFNAFCLLYQMKDGNHWVACVYHPEKNAIYHYDSLGMEPDKELDLDHYKYEKHYTNLLNKSGAIIHSNPYKHQSMRLNVNTCGRFSALRCLLQDLDNHAFDDVLQDIFLNNPDEIATALTLLFSFNDNDE